MPPGGMKEAFDNSLIKSTLMADKGELNKKDQTITGKGENQSAVFADNTATITLSKDQITTSGNTSSNDLSSFQGLNAAVLGRGKSVINMDHNKITTTGKGANAIFAYGQSVIHSDNDLIDCTDGGAHGIMASGGGTTIARNIQMITRGANSGAIATDRGSGTIIVYSGTVKATGPDSPGIYSTGKITVSDAQITATGAEVAVIEGSNSIVLDNCQLKCTYQNKWGVMIYQSFSGDAEGIDGHFELNGGSLTSTDAKGALFFVTNSNANIFLNHAKVSQASGILLNAAATNRWGHEGSNGGKAHIIASQQSLKGDLTADKSSTIELNLQSESKLEGKINADNSAQNVKVKIDESSSWSLSDDSYINHIDAQISGDHIDNIIGNGHNLYYQKTDCPSLKGRSYQLKNGGQLKAL